MTHPDDMGHGLVFGAGESEKQMVVSCTKCGYRLIQGLPISASFFEHFADAVYAHHREYVEREESFSFDDPKKPFRA